MKRMSNEDASNVGGGLNETPWYGPFEVYRPGQPVDPNSPWAPPIPGYPF